MFDIFNWLANQAVDGKQDQIFGTKPGVAEFTPTDLGTEAGRAVDSNIKNVPEIQALLEKLLPGYGEMVKTGSANTLSLLRGELPTDVQDAIKRSSAFRSLQGGYSGSGMSKALTARDIGRTSLDLMGEGQNAAQRWAAFTQGSASPYVVTAPAQAENTTRNNLYSQATSQFKYNVAAAPDPGAAGIFNLQTTLGSMAASFGLGSAMQGMKGTSATAAPASSSTNTGTSNNAYPYNWWGG